MRSCSPAIVIVTSIICNHPTKLNNKVKKTHLQKHQRIPRTRSFLKIARKTILQSCNPIRCVTSQIICIISIICNHPTNLNNKVKKTHLQKHQRNPRTRSFLKIARKPILQSCNPIRCVTSDTHTHYRQTDGQTFTHAFLGTSP